ncbi:hypothetical protein M408DRAFT_29362 [Serendipita vermifera MAFF 305830]|uniref:Uncharacterized protein n=1 Tax=Serendipita vermifera MAFF 305830 TaxID=933852 RepID=A0A0C2W5F7_SERVB|nr:hypothetical protein M408DRAFT_29362 [Serendipita vermifera MAFF 305830]
MDQPTGGNASNSLFRTLPDYYPNGSIYAHFPFITPNEMKIWLTKMELADQYSFTPLHRDPVRPMVPIDAAKEVKQVLTDAATLKTTYDNALSSREAEASLSGSARSQGISKRVPWYASRFLSSTTVAFYKATTRKLIERRSFASGPNRRAVNITHDVLNIVPAHWVCEEITVIPLKSEDAPRGSFIERVCLGEVFVDIMIPAVMISIFSLKNLRLGPGSTGVIAKFKSDIYGTETDLYISNKGTVNPFPAFLLVEVSSRHPSF